MNDYRIRILATSDLKGSVFPYNDTDSLSSYSGMIRLKTLIQSLRDENTILIDNGNLLEGSALSQYHAFLHSDSVSPVTLAANNLEYDYISLGGNDYARGEDALNTHLKEMKASCITGNVQLHETALGPTYAIRSCAGRKIALIAASSAPQYLSRRQIRPFSFDDPATFIQKSVELVRSLEKPDYVIVLYHGGFEKDPVTGVPVQNASACDQGYRILTEIRGINVLIASSQGQTVCRNVHQTSVIQMADRGQELACIDISTDDTSIDCHVLKADCEPDTEMAQSLKTEEDACNAWLDEPLAFSAQDMTLKEDDFFLIKPQAVTLINALEKEIVQSDLAAFSLPLHTLGLPRQITMRRLLALVPACETLVTKKITGKILKDYLEKNAECFCIHNDSLEPSLLYKNGDVRYDMVDGIAYTIHAAEDPGHRITDLTKDGNPVQDSDEMTLALPAGHAFGTDGMKMLEGAKNVSVSDETLLSLLAAALKKKERIDLEPVHNISVTR